MALLNLKEFHSPRSLADARAILDANEDALVLSGGTFLHGLEARGLLSDVEALVDIRRIGLDTVEIDGTGLEIGATATFARLQAVPEVAMAPWLGALADALSYPPVQIRNTATFGGCVAAACPFFDVPTALLALDASVDTDGPGGGRSLPLPELFMGLFANTLDTGELITSLSVPCPAGRAASAFLKLEGNANDLAIVNAAVRLTVDVGGVCTDARVALGGGVAESALRIASAEKILQGSRLAPADLQAAGDSVVGEIAPMSDHRASAEYRSAVAKVMTRRALERAVARLA